MFENMNTTLRCMCVLILLLLSYFLTLKSPSAEEETRRYALFLGVNVVYIKQGWYMSLMHA